LLQPSLNLYDESQHIKTLNKVKEFLRLNASKNIFDCISVDEVFELYIYFVPDPNKPKEFEKFYRANQYLYKEIGRALLQIITPSNLTSTEVRQLIDRFPVAGFIRGLAIEDRQADIYYDDLSTHLLDMDQRPNRETAIVAFTGAHTPRTMNYLRTRLATRNPFHDDLFEIIKRMYGRREPLDPSNLTRREVNIAKLVIENAVAASRQGSIATVGSAMGHVMTQHFGTTPRAIRAGGDLTKTLLNCSTKYPTLSGIIVPHIRITNAEQLLCYLNNLDYLDPGNVDKMLSIIPANLKQLEGIKGVYSRIASMEIKDVEVVKEKLNFIAPEILYACIRNGKKANVSLFSGSLSTLATQHNKYLTDNKWYVYLRDNGQKNTAIRASLYFSSIPIAAIGFYWLFGHSLISSSSTINSSVAGKIISGILFVSPIIIVGIFSYGLKQSLDQINDATSFLAKVTEAEKHGAANTLNNAIN
jgi:hypothetical protein